MTTNCIFLEVTNFDYIRTVKNVTFNNFGLINRELCFEYNLNWLCETTPHITLLNDCKNVSNNESYRKLKYGNNELFKKLKKKVNDEGLVFPELIIDTFDNNNNARVLKINCLNCNIINELSEFHSMLKESIENEETYPNYEPHITITYLRKDISGSEFNKIKSELSSLLPKQFSVDAIVLSDQSREHDRIQLRDSIAQFPGF